MSSGYVLDFSNNRFSNFILDSVGVEIYSSKYDGYGDSKAKRLRKFWDIEEEALVLKLLNDLVEYWQENKVINDIEITANEEKIYQKCLTILKRLSDMNTYQEVDGVKKNIMRRRGYPMFSEFGDMLNDTVELKKQSGQVISGIKASVQKSKVYIFDGNLLIEEGDIISRTLSNGGIEEYEVIDRGFHEKWEGVEAHYQCDVQKIIPRRDSTSRVTNINFYAPNARYNEYSTDNSTNVVVNKNMFEDMKTLITQQLPESNERQIIINNIDEMSNNIGTPTFKEKYNNFIQSLGLHINVIAPFLPQLAGILGS